MKNILVDSTRIYLAGLVPILWLGMRFLVPIAILDVIASSMFSYSPRASLLIVFVRVGVSTWYVAAETLLAFDMFSGTKNQNNKIVRYSSRRFARIILANLITCGPLALLWLVRHAGNYNLKYYLGPILVGAVALSFYLLIRCSFVPFLAVIDDNKTLLAIVRSFRLTKGRFLKVLGVMLVLGLPAGAASKAISALLASPGVFRFGAEPILSAVANVLLLLPVIGLLRMYLDIRHEAKYDTKERLTTA